jgi:hypothetical protein
MKAVVLTGYGDMDKLELRDVAEPKAERGSIVVRVVGGSINPIDCCPSPHDQPERGPHALSDLITLAHEYGHFRSWKEAGDGASNNWRTYQIAIETRRDDVSALSQDQKRTIITEERRAWNIGERTLRELYFCD